MSSSVKTLLLGLVSVAFVTAQNDPDSHYGPGRGPGRPGGRGGAGWRNGNGPFGYSDFQTMMSQRQKILIAHGVLGALAFVVLFPLGAIIIRLGSFRGSWIVHGILQTFAYLVYITSFGIGIWMVNNIPVNLLDHYHPTIGIVAFVLLFFQPILGLIHHSQFKKYSRRTVWSYGHLWLGRIVITLGMINGGLGMLLATETGMFVPSRGQMVAYGVIAGLMWLLWVGATIFGEIKRSRSHKRVAAKEMELEEEKGQYA